MAGCAPFTVAFRCDRNALYEKAILKASQAGARVHGDHEEGEISYAVPIFGRVRMHYRIMDGSIEFTCKDRPMLMSCAVLEQAVRDEIAQADRKLA